MTRNIRSFESLVQMLEDQPEMRNSCGIFKRSYVTKIVFDGS